MNEINRAEWLQRNLNDFISLELSFRQKNLIQVLFNTKISLQHHLKI
jgi:hypothetical protein